MAESSEIEALTKEVKELKDQVAALTKGISSAFYGPGQQSGPLQLLRLQMKDLTEAIKGTKPGL